MTIHSAFRSTHGRPQTSGAQKIWQRDTDGLGTTDSKRDSKRIVTGGDQGYRSKVVLSRAQNRDQRMGVLRVQPSCQNSDRMLWNGLSSTAVSRSVAHALLETPGSLRAETQGYGGRNVARAGVEGLFPYSY
jgi:hypothetical protein